MDKDIKNNKLIKSIEENAKKEAEEIIKAAEKIVDERRHAMDKQVKNIISSAEKRIEEQVRYIEKNSASSIAIEKRRISLKIREKIIDRVVGMVEEEMKKSIKNPDYKKIITGWITEAAIGLNCEEASVKASSKELLMIDDTLLKEAEDEVRNFIKKTIKFKKSESQPLENQGPILISSDGRISYDNSIRTRLFRYRSQIRKEVINEIFGE